MNLLGKGTISAALFAATASVICASPAQAFLAYGSSFQFDDVTTTVSNDFTFDQLGSGNGTATFTFSSTQADQFFSTGDFFVMGGATEANDSLLKINGPLAIVNDALASVPSPFLQKIDSVWGVVDFYLTSIDQYNEYQIGAESKGYGFTLKGIFKDANQKQVAGVGTFTGNVTKQAGYAGKFGGNLMVEDVPTPAAVLPILGGLLGMASKRKRNEEENA